MASWCLDFLILGWSNEIHPDLTLRRLFYIVGEEARKKKKNKCFDSWERCFTLTPWNVYKFLPEKDKAIVSNFTVSSYYIFMVPDLISTVPQIHLSGIALLSESTVNCISKFTYVLNFYKMYSESFNCAEM